MTPRPFSEPPVSFERLVFFPYPPVLPLMPQDARLPLAATLLYPSLLPPSTPLTGPCI